jgi:AcrR family transcriptional regulator
LATKTKTSTKARIVEAAFATVREVGYAGASARAIAAKGGFNQALIFYHFGGTDEALLAALDQSTEDRLSRYRERMGAVTALPAMVEAARTLFKDDFDSGHVKLLAELVAAGASNPELGKQVAARVEPSLAFSSETFERLMADSPLAALVPARDAAYALSALYLGMELLANLECSLDAANSLFAAAGRVASLLGLLLPPAGAPAASTMIGVPPRRVNKGTTSGRKRNGGTR